MFEDNLYFVYFTCGALKLHNERHQYKISNKHKVKEGRLTREKYKTLGNMKKKQNERAFVWCQIYEKSNFVACNQTFFFSVPFFTKQKEEDD